MKRLGIAFTFAAALALAAPPPIHADTCYVNPYNYIGYYPDCRCTACGGWALTNCTECVSDDGSGACQTTSTSEECQPFTQH